MAGEEDGFLGRTVHLYTEGVKVAGVKEKSVDLNGEPVNTTDDDSNGWRMLLGDTNSAAEDQVNIDVSGITKSNALKVEWFSRQRLRDRELRYPDGGIISGEFYLANYKETGALDDVVSFEATLQSSGPIDFAPPVGTGT